MGINPPGPITLRDPQGIAVTDIRATARIPIGTYTFECNAEDALWNVFPPPGNGLSFDQREHTLYGTPRSEFDKIQYNITVTNSAGSSSLIFSVESVYCDEGYYVVRRYMGIIKGDILLKHNGVVIEDERDSSIERYFCLPAGELSLSLNCVSGVNDKCFAVVRSTNNITFIHMLEHSGNNVTKTVSMVAKEAPVITASETQFIFPRSRSFTTDITISGIYSDIVYEPEAPSTFRFDEQANRLSGYFLARGVYKYTLTVSNNAGSSSLTLVFYVSTCPENTELLLLEGTKVKGIYYSIYSLDFKPLLSLNATMNYFSDIACLSQGEYFLTAESHSEETNPDPLLLRDANGLIYESFDPVSTDVNNRERFAVGDIVPFGSAMRFLVASSADAKWREQRYKDNKWNEGHAGSFGTFNPRTQNVYFRKQFTVASPGSYSQLLIEMKMEDYAIMYLNNVEVRRFSEQGARYAYLLLDASLLKKGVNQIAVELHGNKQEVTAVEFDMRAHLITSQCMIPELEGRAYSDEKDPDPSNPPLNAFGNSYSFWRSVPKVNLWYELANDTYIMPSKMKMTTPSYTDGHPTKFTVYGIVRDYKLNQTVYEDELASVDSTAFLWKVDREDVLLNPKRPYNGFRIYFEDTLNHTVLRVSGIEFLECQLTSCKKRIGWKENRVGEVSYGKCPFGSYGVNMRECKRNDVKPEWVENRGMCLKKHSSKGYSYVDMEVEIEGIRTRVIDTVAKVTKEFIEKEMMVREKEITLPYYLQTSLVPLKMKTIVRMTLEREIADYIQVKMKGVVSKYEEYVKKGLKRFEPDTVKVVQGPTLREQFPWSTVVMILSMIAIAIISFILGMIYTYASIRNGRNERQIKRLTKGKGRDENEKLI